MMKMWIIINVAAFFLLGLGVWSPCHAPRLAAFTLIKIVETDGGTVATMVPYSQEVQG